MTLPFLRVFLERAHISQIRAKRLGVKKDKMCFFTIQENFLFQAYAKNVRVPNEKRFYVLN